LGWSPEEWLGRSSSDVLHPDDLLEYAGNLEAIAAGQCVVCRHRIRAKDNSWHWAELHVGPYQDSQNKPDGMVASFRLIDREMAAWRELERHARTDELTGLLNRREGLEQIHILSATDQRSGEQTALLFCDLDRFKAINDRWGHAAGDALLRTVASRIQECLRSEDLAARMGGDELLVVLKGVQNLDTAVGIAEKIRNAVQDPVPTPAGELQITLSIGVTLVVPGESSDTVIARADTAMYEAKQTGRNRVIPIRG
jgi:diguanylate cyclase (GGDEF)-like protein